MTSDERSARIESYGKAYDLLVEAIQQFPRAMWQYRPAPEDWTIHEILVHIADSEVNSYVRCRRLIAEPGSTVLGYDEMQWARVLDYHQQSVEDALELFKWLRRKSYLLVRGLGESVWSHVVTHSESGPMSLDDWLRTYERHVPEHIEQMQRVYATWLARTAS
jgi:hypothetical protein